MGRMKAMNTKNAVFLRVAALLSVVGLLLPGQAGAENFGDMGTGTLMAHWDETQLGTFPSHADKIYFQGGHALRAGQTPDSNHSYCSLKAAEFTKTSANPPVYTGRVLFTETRLGGEHRATSSSAPLLPVIKLDLARAQSQPNQPESPASWHCTVIGKDKKPELLSTGDISEVTGDAAYFVDPRAGSGSAPGAGGNTAGGAKH
jgi:hypothetical protein